MKHSIRIIIAVFIAIIATVVVDSMTNNIDVSKRAIVVGFGVDIENTEYIITADIFSPSQGASSNGNSYIIVTAKGKTLEEAMMAIGSKIGLRPSYKHTQAVLFGESIYKKGYLEPCLKFLFESDDIPDKTLVLASKGEAGKIIALKTIMQDSSSILLNSALKNSKDLGTVSSNLNKYFSNTLSASGSYFLPLVRYEEVEYKPNEATPPEETQFVLRYDESIALTRNSYVELDSAQTRGLSFFAHPITNGIITYVDSNTSEKGFTIINAKTKVNANLKDNKSEITISLSLRNSLKNSTSQGKIYNFIEKEDKKIIHEMIVNDIMSCYEKCKTLGIDIFNLKETYYSRSGKDPSAFFNSSILKVKVKIKIK